MKVVILGFGNVASHLTHAFLAASEVEVVQVYSRSPLDSTEGFEVTHQLSELKSADVYLIAIPDDSIAELSKQLPFEGRLVVHTSGSVSMDSLSEKNRRGIFYPLQTFSKEREVDFQSIPICVEAEEAADATILKKLGGFISQKIVTISSEQRRELHLAAVFANNFTNHLYQISETLLVEYELDFDLLKPLILETAKKIETLTPEDAQTGPAKRKDQKTIKAHLKLLKSKDHQKIYKTLTKSIQKTHGKKL